MMQKCWSADPASRPTFADLLDVIRKREAGADPDDVESGDVSAVKGGVEEEAEEEDEEEEQEEEEEEEEEEEGEVG